MKKRNVAGLGIALAIAGCSDQSPLLRPYSLQKLESPTIPGVYVVRLRADVGDVPALAHKLVSAHGGRVRSTWRLTIRGFAAELPADEVASLAQDSGVWTVTPARAFHMAATQSNPPSWGLDRVDQRLRPMDHSYR